MMRIQLPRVRCVLETVLVETILSAQLTFLRTKLEGLEDGTSAPESDHKRLRAQLGVIINGFERTTAYNPALEAFRSESISNAIASDQEQFRTQLGLIRDGIECRTIAE